MLITIRLLSVVTESGIGLSVTWGYYPSASYLAAHHLSITMPLATTTNHKAQFTTLDTTSSLFLVFWSWSFFNSWTIMDSPGNFKDPWKVARWGWIGFIMKWPVYFTGKSCRRNLKLKFINWPDFRLELTPRMGDINDCGQDCGGRRISFEQ